MSNRAMTAPPPALRAAIAADLRPVRPLAAPWRRALMVAPVAAGLLLAAPLVFQFRDLDALGWTLSWGASFVQAIAGLALVAASLRESVPGRSWSGRALGAIIGGTVLLIAAVTVASWHASPVSLSRGWWQIGAVCLVASTVTALPATILAAILALQALPTRPAVTGVLAGLGGGLMADAGWRLFCHFSQPSHVLASHLGGVVLAAAIGAAITPWLSSRR